MRRVAIIAVSLGLVLGAGSASSGARVETFHRGCPTDEVKQGPGTFNAAVAQAKRALYGQHFNIQGTDYVTGARNEQLVAAMLLQDHFSLVPGMRGLRAKMKVRCGKRSPPYGAWAFVFHFEMNIVPDYVPTFVTRTASGWYVF